MTLSVPESLLGMQQHFKQFLFDENQLQIVSEVAESTGIDKQTRLAIYANAYVSRLVEVLEQDFSAIHTLLGDEQFTQLATEYIQQHPSKFYTLRYFGQYMRAFVEQHPTYKQHPFLSELAEYEWGFIEAFDSKDVDVVGESEVANVPVEAWPEMRFEFHPSIQVIPYQWNIIPMWQASENEEDLPQPQKLPEQNACIIWRQGLLTQYRSLEFDEINVLALAQQAGTFSDCCEHIAESENEPEQAALRAASLMKNWIATGLIVRLLY